MRKRDSASCILYAVLPKALVVGALLCSVYSCNVDGCLENRSSIPLAGFYGTNGASISLDSLRVTGIGLDTVALSEEGQHVSQLYLPMRATQNSTSWQFCYKWSYLGAGTLSDTISFDYDASPYFASDECGVIYRYHIKKLSHTSHLIDSIALTDSLITNLDIERIKIYFRTAADADTQY